MAPFPFPLYVREERQIREKALDLLAAVGLDKLAGEDATSLPYGAQRRLEIARAWPRSPRSCFWTSPRRG